MLSAEQIAAKLAALTEAAEKKSKSKKDLPIWKPANGQQTIRLIPNKLVGVENPPFIPVDFYYNFGATWIAPAYYEKPDPIADFRQKLLADAKETQDREENRKLWVLSKKFEPVTRIYCPILVRGKEHEGPKWWGISSGLYQEFMAYYNDSDWGNISDAKAGRDIVVTYTPKVEGQENSYPKTEIMLKPKETPLTTEESVMQSVKEMQNILDLFHVPTYDECVAGLEKFMGKNQGESEKQPDQKPATQSTPKSTSKEDAKKAENKEVNSGFDVNIDLDELFGDE